MRAHITIVQREKKWKELGDKNTHMAPQVTRGPLTYTEHGSNIIADFLCVRYIIWKLKGPLRELYHF